MVVEKLKNKKIKAAQQAATKSPDNIKIKEENIYQPFDGISFNLEEAFRFFIPDKVLRFCMGGG